MTTFSIIQKHALALASGDQFSAEDLEAIQMLMMMDKPSDFRPIIKKLGIEKLDDLAKRLRDIPSSDAKLDNVNILLSKIVSQAILGEVIL